MGEWFVRVDVSDCFASFALTILVFHQGLGHGDPAGHQVIVFLENEASLSARGINCKLVRVKSDEQRIEAVEASQPHVVVDFRHWSESIDEVRRSIENIRHVRSGLKYVLMDYYASTASPHLPLVDDVDLYAKRQVLRDRAAYDKPYQGSFIVTDFLAREMGYELKGWALGSQVSETMAQKVMPVWNLGAISKYGRLASTLTARLPWGLRRTDVNVRIGLEASKPQDEWYQQYRRQCIETLTKFSRNLRLSSIDRVSSRRYFLGLMTSKVVFSPFGWGEVCFRDYEAVACGCLLLKQDMSHLETEPNIYRPMETYVPVKWDLSDLHERLDWIFSNPVEASMIAKAGRAALRAYFQAGGALPTILRMLSAVTSVDEQNVQLL